MSTQFGNVAFIIWRESVEALLVIGILNAWLASQREIASRGRIFLWAGVATGLLVAVGLGVIFIAFGEAISDEAQQGYQTGAVLVAAALIIQMVFWMRRHGCTLKRELETSLQDAAARSSWWTVFILALVAVAREGSETVVFLFGTLAAIQHASLAGIIVAIIVGFALALATYYVLQLGSRVLSWRGFFGVTEGMLLRLAGTPRRKELEKMFTDELVTKFYANPVAAFKKMSLNHQIIFAHLASQSGMTNDGGTAGV